MSKAVSVLKVFLDQPDTFFSPRDISRKCGITWYTASKSIQEIMSKTGLLEEEQDNTPGWRRFRISKKRG